MAAIRACSATSLLAITQNANMNVPVLAIGGSNGLAFQPSSFASYLGLIATPRSGSRWRSFPAYAHLDLITADCTTTRVPIITDWVNRVQQKKLLEHFSAQHRSWRFASATKMFPRRGRRSRAA